jgi:hypothetical protein
MSQSSGVFSFPSTGDWEVEAVGQRALPENQTERSCSMQIHRTTNNSTYTSILVASGSIIQDATTARTQNIAKLPLKVTDIANQKVRFHSRSSNTNTQTEGSTTVYNTYFIFRKYAQ